MRNKLCAVPPDHVPAARCRVASSSVGRRQAVPLSVSCVYHTPLHNTYQVRITPTTQTHHHTHHTHHTHPPPTPTTHPPHTHHTPTTHPPQPSTASKKSQCSITSPTVSQANIIKHRYTHITLKNLRVDSTLARGQVESPFLRHNKTHEKCTLRGIMSQHVMSCQRTSPPYIQWRCDFLVVPRPA